MNPDMSHALVKDLMVKTVETNCTVESASLSSPSPAMRADEMIE